MTVRVVPRSLAPLLQLLELEQPRVLTAAQLADVSREAGVEWSVALVIRRLREHGWLLPLETKGVWEFAPASRAGAFGSGDPLVELRAVLARDQDAPYRVAAESAAYLLGLAGRRPEPECVSAPAGHRPLKSLKTLRLVRWEPTTPPVSRDGLPVWAVETLIAFMASRPSGYHDWPNVGDWLPQAAAVVDPDRIGRELGAHSAGAWARAAYLIDRGRAPDRALALMRHAPRGAGPHYLGDRSAQGRYNLAYDVIDSTGIEVDVA